MTNPSESSDRPLALSRTVLGILIKLNIVLGFAIFALLIASLINGSFVFRALGVISTPDSARLFLGMRGIMVVGIIATPVLHVIYTRLLAIVETVTAGDPFVGQNASRLQSIAWAIVGLELMHVAVVILASGVIVDGHKVDIGGKFSITPWLTILLLFVLARVFDQGARMRDDLAGTV